MYRYCIFCVKNSNVPLTPQIVVYRNINKKILYFQIFL